MIRLVVISSLLALFNYYQIIIRLTDYMADHNVILSKNDLLNRLLIVSNFKQFPYMAEDSIFVFLPIFLFYFGTVFFTSLGYLSKKKEYHAFICSRSETQHKALMTIKGSTFPTALLLVSSYHVVLFGCIYYLNDWQLDTALVEILGRLILYVIAQAIVITAISLYSFIIYLKKDEAFSLLFSILTVMFLFMLDMKVTQVNVVFFDDVNYKLSSLAIVVAALILARIFIRKLNYELI